MLLLRAGDTLAGQRSTLWPGPSRPMTHRHAPSRVERSRNSSGYCFAPWSWGYILTGSKARSVPLQLIECGVFVLVWWLLPFQAPPSPGLRNLSRNGSEAAAHGRKWLRRKKRLLCPAAGALNRLIAFEGVAGVGASVAG
jgi:hypothetical protein